MKHYLCPYLNQEVTLSDERFTHITSRHPEMLQFETKIGEVLADPDQIRTSKHFNNAHLFTRWFDDVMHGKHVVVVVISNAQPQSNHWIITAYIARKIKEGNIEWQRT